MLTETAVLLGPATVMSVRGDRLRLRRPEGEVWGRLALAYPYRPMVGDVVLAIGAGEAFVIGVLEGKGKTRFDVQGDLEMHATGRVRLTGDTGVEIESPRLAFKADKLELTARVIMERAVSCYRRIRDTLQCEAGRIRTLVHGQATFKAQRILETAEKEVKIDGQQIHLG